MSGSSQSKGYTLETLITALCETDDDQLHKAAQHLRQAVYCLNVHSHWLDILIGPPLAIRCMKHRNVPQINTKAEGAECPACGVNASEEFWAYVEANAAEVTTWPDWMKGGKAEGHIHKEGQ